MQTQACARGQPQQAAHHGHRLGRTLHRQARHRELAATARKHNALDGALQDFLLGCAGALARRSVEKIHASTTTSTVRASRSSAGIGEGGPYV